MKRHTARATLIAGLTGITILFAYMAFFSFQTAMNHNDRIPASKTTNPLPQDSAALTQMAATAIRYRSEQIQTINVSVSRNDFPDFNDHLNNITTNQGWLLHSPGKTQVYLVIPQDQIHLLKGMEQNGAEWLLSHNPPDEARRPQADTHFVNVRLQLRPPMGMIILLLIAILACAVAAIATLTAAATHTITMFKELSKHQTTRLTNNQTPRTNSPCSLN